MKRDLNLTGSERTLVVDTSKSTPRVARVSSLLGPIANRLWDCGLQELMLVLRADQEATIGAPLRQEICYLICCQHRASYPPMPIAATEAPRVVILVQFLMVRRPSSVVLRICILNAMNLFSSSSQHCCLWSRFETEFSIAEQSGAASHTLVRRPCLSWLLCNGQMRAMDTSLYRGTFFFASQDSFVGAPFG
jgi:hypothetical protein